ncbi:MAG: hypothetical protein KKB70_09295 [Proteobacteria bacterium]|nr:hypothetical protein [Pseudomonadota bacterium]
MIIHFPAMLPGLLTAPAPIDGRYFDPGLTDEPAEGGYRPENLPLNPATARRLVEDSLRYGEQFKKPGEMAAQALSQEVAGKDQEHSWTIRAELEDRLKHDASARAGTIHAQEDADELAQAQFLLLLSLVTQQHTLELHDLGRNVGDAWENFGQKLGLGDDEDADLALERQSRALQGTGELDDRHALLPWPKLLGAMAVYLPEGAVLAATDPEPAATWRDLGLSFAPAAPSLGLPTGWETATGPAWKLVGRSKAPAGPQWERELTVAIPAA